MNLNDIEFEEPPAYLREMQIILANDLIAEAEKQAITLKQLIGKMRARGVTDQEIRSTLLDDLLNGGQIFGDFRKNFKTHVKYGIEENARGEIQAAFETAQQWDWIGIADGKLCDDCLKRHNMPANTYEFWQALGLPGQGTTICKENCRCDLIPIGLIDKQKIPVGIERTKK